jgi:hypothetical protein
VDSLFSVLSDARTRPWRVTLASDRPTCTAGGHPHCGSGETNRGENANRHGIKDRIKKFGGEQPSMTQTDDWTHDSDSRCLHGSDDLAGQAVGSARGETGGYVGGPKTA